MLSRWPRYPARVSKRGLAYYRDGSLLLADTGEVYRPDSWDEWRTATAGERSYVVLTDDLASSRWIAEAIANPDTGEVVCDKKGHVLTVRAGGKGHRKSVLVDRKKWDDGLSRDELIEAIYQFTEHVGCGIQPSIAACGAWHMARAYGREHGPRFRPPVYLRNALLANAVGGLVDTPGEGERIPFAWEIDRRSAYVAEAGGELPCGSPIRLPRGVQWAYDYPIWYGSCTVIIADRLPVPLVSIPGGKGEVRRLREVGVYGGKYTKEQVWLWSTEAQALRAYGVSVYPIHGWAWQSTYRPLASWADEAWQLRQSAPAGQVQAWVKQAIVAAVGRLGIRPISYRLALQQDHPGATPVLRHTWPTHTDYCVVPVEDTETASPVEWHSAIVARARVTLWLRAMAEIEAGRRVLAMDHDSVVLDGPSRLPVRPDELGEWREKRLDHVWLPAPRHIVSDQVTRRPGIHITA